MHLPDQLAKHSLSCTSSRENSLYLLNQRLLLRISLLEFSDVFYNFIYFFIIDNQLMLLSTA